MNKDKKYVLEIIVRETENLEKIKSEVAGYFLDPINNKHLSKKKQCEEEMQNILFKTDDKDDPKMTDEDWEDLTKHLYLDEYYPKDYAENNCMYYLEFFQNDRWKLYL
ncbi:hypothetical protein EBU94_07185, partial [bacterium]|nr:hypothetical protein [bacterium]